MGCNAYIKLHSISGCIIIFLVPSPSLSSTHGSEEASHVGSILVSVCNSKEIGSDAIAKLCDHVKADPQEQQVR